MSLLFFSSASFLDHGRADWGRPGQNDCRTQNKVWTHDAAHEYIFCLLHHFWYGNILLLTIIYDYIYLYFL